MSMTERPFLSVFSRTGRVGGAIQRPELLNSSGKSSLFMDSWMKDKVRYSEKDKEKLEKGSGYVKLWTLVSKWVYRLISW